MLIFEVTKKNANCIFIPFLSSYFNFLKFTNPQSLFSFYSFRISNFLLWQLAYTELYFTETLWPDFNEEEFDKALLFYAKRERRFGFTSEQLTEINA